MLRTHPLQPVQGWAVATTSDHGLQEAGMAAGEAVTPAAAHGLPSLQDQEYSAAAWWAMMLSQGLRLHHDQGVNPTSVPTGLNQCTSLQFHAVMDTAIQIAPECTAFFSFCMRKCHEQYGGNMKG